MSQLLGLFGLSGGYSSTSGNSSTQTSGSSSSTPTYTPQQTALQGTLAQALAAIISGNGYSPAVQSLQTQSANQINQTAQGTNDRVTNFLASRGLGPSGLAGGAALQTELARESQLANNNSNFASLALSQLDTGLSDALTAAYINPGQSLTYNQIQNQQTSGSGWGFGVGGGFGAGTKA